VRALRSPIHELRLPVHPLRVQEVAVGRREVVAPCLFWEGEVNQLYWIYLCLAVMLLALLFVAWKYYQAKRALDKISYRTQELESDATIGKLRELVDTKVRMAELQQDLDYLKQIKLPDGFEQILQAAKFHPRAWKLAVKRKPFLVVAVDEEYYNDVYSMIRHTERLNNRWSENDEAEFQRMCAESDKLRWSRLGGVK
jgi:5-bromo-4-chloroindolyl phosphate hydrolysis protein